MAAKTPTISVDQFATFGDLLKYLRRRAGLTQRELSIAVGYSDAMICRLEQNQRLPDIATLTARFVPALNAQDEPAIVHRLLELATQVRREDAPASGLPPYKGLLYFNEADADLFFGRATLTARLVERVTALLSTPGAPRFLAVLGASGSGKSSVVRAGLIPALQWQPQAAGWPIHILTPTAHPLDALAASLLDEAKSSTARATLVEELAQDGGRLQQALKTAAARMQVGQIVLIVDQFEELFTLCRSDAERHAFVDNLLCAAGEPHGPGLLVIALRADFYAHCADFADLRVALAHQQEYIGAMSPAELKQAIEEPARRGTWEFEPGLVEVLLQDVAGEPGALPLLSHALLATWERRRGRTLTLSGYAASGGVRGAIAETAETALHDQLNEAQRAIARQIFLRLTEFGEDEAAPNTRRRVALNELIAAPEKAGAVREVLTILADARLVTTERETAEVAHEALLREWPTLREWLVEDRDGLRLQRRLTNTALEWERSGRQEGELFHGARLAQALEWAQTHGADLNRLEHEFLAASRERVEREAAERERQRQRELESAQRLAESERQRTEAAERAAQSERQRAAEQARNAAHMRTRNQVISVVGAAAFVLAILAGLFGWQSSQNALKAQASFSRAEAQRLAAEANRLVTSGGDPQLAALLSIQSLKIGNTPEGLNVLVQANELAFPRRPFTGHTGMVYGVAFSPDGRLVLTGSEDKTARLWDLQTGQELRRFSGHAGILGEVAYSPDGQYVATAGIDGRAQVWVAETGERVGPWLDHGDYVLDVAFSPDGRYLLTGTNRMARLWDAHTGAPLSDFIGHTDYVKTVAFSPDGRYALTGSDDKTARLYDVETGQEVRVFTGHTLAVSGVAFAPDGRYILTGSFDGTARLWDVQTGQTLRFFTANSSFLERVALSADGRYALTAGRDGTARLWDVQTGQPLRIFPGHGANVLDVAFSPDGRSVLTGGAGTVAWLWDAGLEAGLPIYHGHRAGVWGAAFSPDGQRLLTGSADTTARLWEVRSGQQLQMFLLRDRINHGVAFSPAGNELLIGTWDGNTVLLDAKTGKEVRRFVGHTDAVNGAVFSPDGTRVATASGTNSDFPNDKSARLWDARTGQPVLVLEGHDGRVYSVAFSPDGRWLLTGSWDRTARLWDAQTGAEVRRFTGHTDYVNGVAFSPDGRFVATASHDQTVRVWSVETGSEVQRLNGHTDIIWSVAYSPDGAYLLTGSEDHTARLWDAQTGQETRRFTGHTAGVDRAVFSPDGQYIVTASDDGTARLWRLDYYDTIQYLCSRLLRDLTDQERQEYGLQEVAPTCP